MFTYYIGRRENSGVFLHKECATAANAEGTVSWADGGYIPLDDPHRARGSEKHWGERDQAVMMEFMLRTGYNAHECKMHKCGRKRCTSTCLVPHPPAVVAALLVVG